MKRPPANTPALYAQDGKGYDATVFAHYFVGGCDWFVTEYDADEDVAFGWACLGDRQNAELGYMSLAELESIKVPITIIGIAGNTFGVEVDYDEHWTPCTLREAIDKLDAQQGRTA